MFTKFKESRVGGKEGGETGNSALVWKLQKGSLYSGIFLEPLKSFSQKKNLCHGEMFMIQQVKNQEIIHHKTVFPKQNKNKTT